MHVVVTGGSGFIGRHVVSRLCARGDEVVVVDLKPFRSPEAACVVGDLRDPEIVARAITPGTDGVVHLAAITSVLLSAKDPHAVFQTNVDATELVLERCRELGVGRFVFASTNAVAGNVGAVTNDETGLPRPLTPSVATKAAAEMLLCAYAASYQMTTVALRFTNVYGAGMQTKDSVVARLMRGALDGGAIQIYGDGEQRRDYVYVTDVVSSIELGLALPAPDTLTIGGGKSVSMNELWQTTRAVTGVEIPAEHVPAKPGEMPAVVVDTSHAKSLGYAPTFDLASGLAATWEDFRRNGGSAPA